MHRMPLLPDSLMEASSCPRCSSLRIFASSDEFICLSCSYIVVSGGENE